MMSRYGAQERPGVRATGGRLTNRRSVSPVAARVLVAAATAAATVLFAGTLSRTAVAAPAFGGLPGNSAAAPGFQPLSLTFASQRVGWVVGTVVCGHGRRCLALRETKDAGLSWAARAIPPAMAVAITHAPVGLAYPPLGVQFADSQDGWLYADGGLWSTHDGGHSWQRHTPPNLAAPNEDTILDVASAAGKVYLLGWAGAKGVIVDSSPAKTDRWHPARTPHLGLPAGGGLLVGALVLQGSAGWLVEGNDRGISGSARLDRKGHWLRWTPPCAALGNSFTVPTLVGPQSLDAVCVMGGFASPLPNTAPPGATLGSSWLYSSNDGGATFRPVTQLGLLGTSFGDLVSPAPGVLLVTQSGAHGDDLLQSLDGGTDFAVVYRGVVGALAFATPTHGLAIIEKPSHATAAIKTTDGGRHWTAVRF
jgi:hypothetical protein